EVTPSSDRPGRRRILGVLVALTVVAVVAAVVAALQWRRTDDLESERDERREVSAVVGGFADAFLSVSTENLGQTSERVRDYVSSNFVGQLEDTPLDQIAQVMQNLGLSFQAQAQEVYVGDIGDAEASAVVRVDLAIPELPDESGQPARLEGMYMVVSLVQQDGRWLVDRTRSTAPRFPALEELEAQASTTTTAPPPG
ncbi:MAG: hypothetical protein ACRD0G_11565, partial [Acidimicrobiales bacterium]